MRKQTDMMPFSMAFARMLEGARVRLPGWLGWWAWENGTIMIHLADGTAMDIRDTDSPATTFMSVAAGTWEVVPEESEARG